MVRIEDENIIYEIVKDFNEEIKKICDSKSTEMKSRPELKSENIFLFKIEKFGVSFCSSDNKDLENVNHVFGKKFGKMVVIDDDKKLSKLQGKCCVVDVTCDFEIRGIKIPQGSLLYYKEFKSKNLLKHKNTKLTFYY